ncbi:Glyoxalase-like domain protein [Corynebacterium hansenii]|nr:Glyoxalase-like domain protein [Corynebacterium hansenii]
MIERMTTTKPQLFHSLTYADADKGLAFLAALGFEQILVVRDDADPSRVEHAELRWRDSGGIMLGSNRRAGTHEIPDTAGQKCCYLVVPTDADVDATYEKALANGATTIEKPADQPYGGRVATVADPEGNHWSVGSYPGQ